MEKEKLLTLTHLGEIGGDCTGPMYFKLARECTVRELCDFIVANKGEWGYIRIQALYPGFDLSEMKSEIEYFHGDYVNRNREKILFDLVDDVANAIVTKVDAHGGWSNVDYILTVKRGQKVEVKSQEDKLLDMQKKIDYLEERNLALTSLLKQYDEDAEHNCHSCTDPAAIGHWQGVSIIYKEIIKMIENENFFDAKLAEYIQKNRTADFIADKRLSESINRAMAKERKKKFCHVKPSEEENNGQ